MSDAPGGVRARVVNAGGVPMSALVAEAQQPLRPPRAVIVALHGGGTTSVYFDCPGRPRLSLLRSGATAGYTVVALDRPGYGSSALYPEAMADAAQRVDLVYAAIDRLLGDRPRGAGVFIMGHSAGCVLALQMAADVRGAGLLGLELAGTGRHYHPAARNTLADARPDHRPPGLRDLLWEPAHLYPGDIAGAIGHTGGIAPYESATPTDWSGRELPALAARVRVPVQLSFAEHERVWRADPDAQVELAGLFHSAPQVAVNERAETGHNLSLGWSAAAYHGSVFSFVEQCAVGSTAPELDRELG